jgi:hypothetical protein
MANSWDQPEGWRLLYSDGCELNRQVLVLIGHDGVSVDTFWKKVAADAELSKLPKHRVEDAARRLTAYGLYYTEKKLVLLTHVAKAGWMLLGPPAGDPDYIAWWQRRAISLQAEGKELPPHAPRLALQVGLAGEAKEAGEKDADKGAATRKRPRKKKEGEPAPAPPPPPRLAKPRSGRKRKAG